MACNNCMNGCINPQMCSCDCNTCAEANSCDIPVGDVGPQGPPGPMGPPGTPCNPCNNGVDGTDGCSLLDIYISDGTDGNNTGDVIVTTGPAPIPCSQTINAGNVIDSIVSQGSTVPSGIIVMWSGAVANLPLNWVLCDGTNGTPDLRGRFIGSYGPDPAHAPFNGINGTGGSNSVSLTQTNIPAHTHDVGGYFATSSIPLPDGIHRHTLITNSGGNGGSQGNSCYRTTGNDQPVGNNATMFTGNSLPWPSSGSDEGAHTHAIVTTLGGNSGDGQPALSAPQGTAFTVIPKYYTLAFIMKQ